MYRAGGNQQALLCREGRECESGVQLGRDGSEAADAGRRHCGGDGDGQLAEGQPSAVVLSWLGLHTNFDIVRAIATISRFLNAAGTLLDEQRLMRVLQGRTGAGAGHEDETESSYQFISSGYFQIFLRASGLLDADHAEEDNEGEEDPWVDVKHLFRLPYWSRVWIVQEIILAQKCHELIVDGAYFDWNFLRRFHQVAMNLFALFSKAVGISVAQSTSNAGRSLDPGMLGTVHSRLTDINSDIRAVFGYQALRSLADEKDAMGIMEIPLNAQGFESTDLRDGIYGLLGLTGNSSIIPNYNLPVRDVFIDWFGRCLETYWQLHPKRFLMPLQNCGLPPKVKRALPDVPTWVPKLHPRKFLVIDTARCDDVRFGTDRETQRPSFTDNGGLNVLAAFCDDIIKVQPIASENDLKLAAKPYWGSDGRHDYPSGISAFRAFARAFYTGIDVSVASLQVTILRPALQIKEGQSLDIGGFNFNDDESHLGAALIYFLTGYAFPKQLIEIYSRDKQHFWSAGEQERIQNDEKFSKGLHYMYLKMSEIEKSDMAVFETTKGYIGSGSANTQPGDKVFLLSGCPVPVILRPDGDGWLLVSSCYVEGLSHGEGLELIKQEELTVAELTIS